MNKWHFLWINVDLMTTERLRLKSGGTSTELQREILDGELKMCLQISAALSKKPCIFKTQTLFCPIVVFCNCSALLSQWHYTAEITTSESQYEAEFWCIRQVFLQSSQKMKIIWALRDNLVQTLAVTAESFAYITLFPHRWLCLSSLSQRTCPLSHLLHWRQVGLNLKSVTVPNMSLTELNRVIIAFTLSSQQDSVAKKDT